MKIYELTNRGYESVEDDLPQIIFTEENCYRSSIDNHCLKLGYELDSIPFDINLSYFLILLQDIHNNIPCGTLFVNVPVDEEYDIIKYIVRFEEKEFEKIKKIYLTNFPEWIII